MARRRRRNPTAVVGMEHVPAPRANARDLADANVTFGDALLAIAGASVVLVAGAWLLRPRPAPRA